MKCKLISLEQRRKKQLLSLMSMLSHDKTYLHVPGRATRNADRIVKGLNASSLYYADRIVFNCV